MVSFDIVMIIVNEAYAIPFFTGRYGRIRSYARTDHRLRLVEYKRAGFLQDRLAWIRPTSL